MSGSPKHLEKARSEQWGKQKVINNEIFSFIISIPTGLLYWQGQYYEVRQSADQYWLLAHIFSMEVKIFHFKMMKDRGGGSYCLLPGRVWSIPDQAAMGSSPAAKWKSELRERLAAGGWAGCSPHWDWGWTTNIYLLTNCLHFKVISLLSPQLSSSSDLTDLGKPAWKYQW